MDTLHNSDLVEPADLSITTPVRTQLNESLSVIRVITPVMGPEDEGVDTEDPVTSATTSDQLQSEIIQPVSSNKVGKIKDESLNILLTQIVLNSEELISQMQRSTETVTPPNLSDLVYHKDRAQQILKQMLNLAKEGGVDTLEKREADLLLQISKNLGEVDNPVITITGEYYYRMRFQGTLIGIPADNSSIGFHDITGIKYFVYAKKDCIVQVDDHEYNSLYHIKSIIKENYDPDVTPYDFRIKNTRHMKIDNNLKGSWLKTVTYLECMPGTFIFMSPSFEGSFSELPPGTILANIPSNSNGDLLARDVLYDCDLLIVTHPPAAMDRVALEFMDQIGCGVFEVPWNFSLPPTIFAIAAGSELLSTTGHTFSLEEHQYSIKDILEKYFITWGVSELSESDKFISWFIKDLCGIYFDVISPEITRTPYINIASLTEKWLKARQRRLYSDISRVLATVFEKLIFYNPAEDHHIKDETPFQESFVRSLDLMRGEIISFFKKFLIEYSQDRIQKLVVSYNPNKLDETLDIGGLCTELSLVFFKHASEVISLDDAYHRIAQNTTYFELTHTLDEVFPCVCSSLQDSLSKRILEFLSNQKKDIAYPNGKPERYICTNLTSHIVKVFITEILPLIMDSFVEKYFLMAKTLNHSTVFDCKIWDVYNPFLVACDLFPYIPEILIGDDQQMEVSVEDHISPEKPKKDKYRFRLRRQNTL